MSGEANKAFRYYVIRDTVWPVSVFLSLWVFAVAGDPSFAMLAFAPFILVAHKVNEKLKALTFQLSLEQKRRRYRMFLLSDFIFLSALLALAFCLQRPLWWGLAVICVVIAPFGIYYGRQIIFEEER